MKIADQLKTIAKTAYSISVLTATKTDPDPTGRNLMALKKRWQDRLSGRRMGTVEKLERDLAPLGYRLQIVKDKSSPI